MHDDHYLQALKLRAAQRLFNICKDTPNRSLMEFALNLIPVRRRHALQKKLIELPPSIKSQFLGTPTTSKEEDQALMFADVSDFLHKLWFHSRQMPRSRWRAVGQATCAILQKLEEAALRRAIARKCIFLGNLHQLEQTFNLKPTELEIIIHCFLRATDCDYSSAISGARLELGKITLNPRLFARFAGLRITDVREAVTEENTLFRARLVEQCSGGNIETTQPVDEFLNGVANRSLFDQYFGRASFKSDLTLGDFPHSIANTSLMLKILSAEGPANLLLHGVPGSGKTAFASLLAQECGGEVFFLRQANGKGKEDLDHRKGALVAAQHLLSRKPSVLIVDECDPLINSKQSFFWLEVDRGDQKSWVNHYLETSSLKIIWISNRINGIDESTARRFSYVQKFTSPNTRQRAKAWNIIASRHKASFLNESLVESLAARYELGPGSAEIAMRHVSSISAGSSSEEKLSMLENMLSQHQQFLKGSGPKLVGLTDAYDASALKTNVPLDKIAGSLQRFFQSAQSPSARQVPNLNLLLSGPPGTGKTEYIKHLAKITGRDLLVKRASDLISSYLGESEKQIAEAFATAQSQGSILFLDEADSLFIDRAGAHRSWEVSQTNELLCQMENFQGVLACATNHDQNMDPAVMRRFTFKVKFDFLDEGGKLKLFERVLGPVLASQLSETERESLKRIPFLTPGDFKVVFQKHAFGELATATALMEDLRAESKAKRISSGALGLTP